MIVFAVCRNKVSMLLTNEEKYHTVVEKVLGFAKKRNASIWLTKKIIERTVYMYVAAYFICYKVNFPKLKKNGKEGRYLIRGQTFVDMGLSETKYDLLQTLKEIKCPILMFLGSHDRMTNAKKLKNWKHNLNLLSVQLFLKLDRL